MHDFILENSIKELRQYFHSLEYVKPVKSGKEAEVHLVEEKGNLMALKIYKGNMKYSSRLEYMPLNSIGDKRMRKAISKRSKTGISSLREMWTQREYKMLSELFELGANVPEVYGFTSESILMQYLGDENSPAPRLSDTTISKEEAKIAFEIIIDNIKLFLEYGIVHGDLSQYNILWHNKMPYIIDFPQVLFFKNNRNAFEKFRKDIDNIRDYFGKYGIDLRDLDSLRM